MIESVCVMQRLRNAGRIIKKDEELQKLESSTGHHQHELRKII